MVDNQPRVLLQFSLLLYGISRVQLVIVLETGAEWFYSPFNAANSQLAGGKAPITYSSDVWLTMIQLKQHHLCNIVSSVWYCILLETLTNTAEIHTNILRMQGLCGKQYLIHVHVNQLSVWGFTSLLPLLDWPPEHLQYIMIQVHATAESGKGKPKF